jgi:hypothetical protein
MRIGGSHLAHAILEEALLMTLAAVVAVVSSRRFAAVRKPSSSTGSQSVCLPATSRRGLSTNC